MLDEAFNDVQVADLARQQERRRAETSDCIRIGAALQQQLYDGILARLDRCVQRRPARNRTLFSFRAMRRDFRVGAAIEQELDDFY